MADFMVDIPSNVFETLADELLLETRLPWGVKSEIQKLSRNFTHVKNILIKAKEVESSHDARQGMCLRQLHDVFYDADDLLSDITAEKSKRQSLKSSSIGRKVSHYFSPSNPLAFHVRIALKIRTINKKLDEAAKNNDAFQLIMNNKLDEVVINRDAFQQTGRHDPRPWETDSFVDPSEVIGRADDVENIVRILMHPIDGPLTVLPIVGIGGLGKTALAKLVFNDERVKMHFDLKMWVYVGNYNVEELVTSIIISAGRGRGLQDDIKNELVHCLGDERYLLVLDDVRDGDKKKWIELKHLLMSGANGSKILVTTQRNDVAQIMGTIPQYDLEGLSIQDSLSLFLRFSWGSDSASLDIKDIGKKIIETCHGVPLALRMMVDTVCLKDSIKNEWTYHVWDNEIWESRLFVSVLLPALKSSYDSLTPNLWRCFKYCSFFPMNYEFHSFELIQFWDACGLLEPNDENREIVAVQSLNSLWSTSLLKHCKEEFFNRKYKIPPLLYDMALYLVRDQFKKVVPYALTNKRIRHLLFDASGYSIEAARRFLNNLGSIKTLIFLDTVEQSIIESFIHRCKHLRVLILRDSSLKVLPSGIRGLKCLMYLDLRGNKKVTKIPNFIYMLQNLQTLMLEGCIDVQELPRDIRYLTALKLLMITTKQRFLPENGVGCLTCLTYLAITGCQNLKYLPQGIHLLTSLQTFIIRDCHSLTSLPRSMKYLVALETLVIANCQKLHLNRKMELDGEDNSCAAHLNESGLSLHQLWIASLPQLLALPEGFVLKSAKTLQHLHIEDCQRLKTIPKWLDVLTSLDNLEIFNCQSLSCQPGITPFTVLTKAKIEGCPHLTQEIIASQTPSGT